jgi:DNA-binding transcriptional ArsR family regulator
MATTSASDRHAGKRGWKTNAGTGTPVPRETSPVIGETAGLFKLLADETRLRILLLLKQEQELNVQTLCGLLHQTQPAVSHHLALLREAGMVLLRRAGKHHFYRLRPKRFADIACALRNLLPEPLTLEVSERDLA